MRAMHAIDERPAAIEHVDVLIGDLAVNLQHEIHFFHRGERRERSCRST